MISQQIIDYIRSQLINGIDKEAITRDLLSKGIGYVDITEGFNLIDAPVSSPIVETINNPMIEPSVSIPLSNPTLVQAENHSTKKIILTAVVLFLLAGGASAYYFRNDLPIIKNFVKSKDVQQAVKIEQADTLLIQNDEVSTTSVEVNQGINKINPSSNLLTKQVNCDYIPDNKIRAACILKNHVAVDCTKIQGDENRFSCVIQENRIYGDYKKCDQFEGIKNDHLGDFKDECYYDVSVHTKNLSLCDNISGQITKDMCLSASPIDESTCGLINSPVYKYRCLVTVNPAKITNGLCDSIDTKDKQDAYDHDTCYYHIIEQSHDVNICHKMISSKSMNNCFYNVATKKLDVKICNMMTIETGPDGRNWCIVGVGRLTNNEALCDLINGEDERQSCRANI